MSGKPNYAQAAQLRAAAKLARITRAEIYHITQQQESLARQRKHEEEVLRKTHNEIWNLLRAMDCDTSVNAGWEARFSELLLMLFDEPAEKSSDPNG